MAEITVGKVAEVVHGAIEGQADMALSGLVPLDQAGPGELSFVTSAKFAAGAAASKAGAIIVSDDMQVETSATLIRVEDPVLAMAQAAWLFLPQADHPGRVCEGAVVDPDAEVAEGASIYPLAYVGPGAEIAAGAVVHPQAYVGPGAKIGTGSVVGPGAVIQHGVTLGKNVLIQPGAVIGGDGFGFAHRPDGTHVRIPQTGTVVVGDEVDVGANTTIDRATFDQTVIGDGVRLDNLVQIGHNVNVGANSILVAQVGISGSVNIGRNCILAGKVGVTDHVNIGDEVTVGAGAGVISDVEPCAQIMGQPAIPRLQALRMMNTMPKLPELMKQVRQLEKRIRELEDRD